MVTQTLPKHLREIKLRPRPAPPARPLRSLFTSSVEVHLNAGLRASGVGEVGEVGAEPRKV